MDSFYLNQPEGPQQDDVPGLLRRVADEIDKLGGEIEVWHVFVHRDEVNEYGDWPQASVYFDQKWAEEDEQPAADAHEQKCAAGESEQMVNRSVTVSGTFPVPERFSKSTFPSE